MRKITGAWIVIMGCAVLGLHAQSTLIYETRFERAEGYDPNLDLAGQRGWRMEGTGGNGLLDGHFPDLGQQAYIGFTPPTTGTVSTVWRPVDYNPVPAGDPVIRFSVKMQIVQSTTGGDDDFRWAVYNMSGSRLFGLSFETRTGEIWFQNEDLAFQRTGWAFGFDGSYDFEIWMDFGRNSWTARLNDLVLANAEPITLTNTTRTLGDVDAVWFINNPAGVGNNFMVFDEYRITAEENLASIPAFLEPAGRSNEGFNTFRVHAQRGVRYSVDYTSNLQEWFSLWEDVNSAGTFIFEDTESPQDRHRFYRLREIQ